MTAPARRTRTRLKVLADRGTLIRYAVSGVGSASLHLSLLVMLVESTGMPSALASSLAFCVTAVVAFWIQHRWVYGSGQAMRRTSPRFLVVAAAAFLINGSTMWIGGHVTDQHYLGLQLLAFVLIPIGNYVLNTLWTFAE